MIYSKHEEIHVQYWKFLMKKGRMTSLLMWFKYKIFLFEKRGELSKGRKTFDRGEFLPVCMKPSSVIATYLSKPFCWVNLRNISFKWNLVLCWLYML